MYSPTPLSSTILAAVICMLGHSSAQIPSVASFPELPSKFQVQVMGINVLKKTTFYVTEVYDQDLQKGVVKVTGTNKKYTIMYDFKQRRAIKIDGTGHCTETGITQSGALVFEDARHLSLGGMVGLFPQMTLQGDSVIDGIQCNIFRAENIYVPSFEANGTVELHWTKPGLNDFANCPSLRVSCVNWTVPIQLMVNGTTNEKKMNYLLFYKFYDFQEHVDELATFELPPGTLCTNLQNNVSFPIMEERYYTGLEIVTKDDITNMEFYVRREDKRGILRIDIDSTELFKDDGTAIDEMDYFRTIIVDDKIGAYYSIDTRKGNCRVLTENAMNDDFKDDLELIINFMMGDNNLNYSYMGLRLNRDQLTEVWSALGYKQKTLNEFYFVETKKISDSHQEQKVYAPLAINISEYTQAGDQIKIGKSTQYNFFNFYPYTPKWSEFDISPCFKGKLSLRFQLKFRQFGVNIDPMVGKEEIFEDSLINYFKNYLEVSPIRFQKIKIDFTKDGVIYFMTTLLEDPLNAGMIKEPFPHHEKTNREIYDFFDQQSLDAELIALEVTGVMNLFLKLEEVKKLISAI